MKEISLVTAETRIDWTTDMWDIRSAMPVPDPAWRFTDGQGHRHYYRSPRNPYPSLRSVVDAYGYDEDGERYTSRSHWECRVCGEWVTPGTKVETDKTFVPGLRAWRAVAVVQPATTALELDILNAVQTGECCRFVFQSGVSGEGIVTEVFAATDGPFTVTIQGTGPLTRMAP